MLHGYLSSKESFIRQIDFFARFRRVIAVDMSGFGKSPPIKYPYSLDDYAREIKRVLDEIGAEKADLLAHSFGARVAVRLLKSEKRIDKIVFTGAAGLTPRRNFRYAVRRASFLILKNFLPREKLTKFYSSDYVNLSPVMRESFKKIIADNLDDEYAKISNRTLLIFGKNDTETPLYMARKMNKLMKNSSLAVLKGAGHFCFAEKSAEFNGKVAEFLLSRKQ